MVVKAGDSIPDVELVEGAPDKKVNIASELASGKGLIISVPAAFSESLPPTETATVHDAVCTARHGTALHCTPSPILRQTEAEGHTALKGWLDFFFHFWLIVAPS